MDTDTTLIRFFYIGAILCILPVEGQGLKCCTSNNKKGFICKFNSVWDLFDKYRGNTPNRES